MGWQHRDRELSPTEWGLDSFVFGLFGLPSVITDLGEGRVELVRLADDDEGTHHSFESSFIALHVLLGAGGYAVAIGYVLLLNCPDEVARATAP